MKWFWIFAVSSLLATIVFAYRESSPVVLLSFFNLLALIALYAETRKDKQLARIEKKIDEINVNKVAAKIDALRDEQTNSLLKAFEVEMELSKYKDEQEEKYREVVKKVLELENKLNEKYELLGKSIIKLSKEIKRS
jgi:uncharacterized membrane protein